MITKFKYLVKLAIVFTGAMLFCCKVDAQRICETHTHLEERIRNDQVFAKRYKELINMPSQSGSKKVTLDCEETIIIPVAFHFASPITCEDSECLLSAVEAQLAVLNADFSATNEDYNKYLELHDICPDSYPLSTAPIQGFGTCIQFCLARKNHPVDSGLEDGDPAITIDHQNYPIAYGWGGYLNIFVSNSQNGLGLSALPGNADGDGFWIDHEAFGGPGINCVSGGTINNNETYNLGRTATHEAGHYFGLPHVFKNCTDSDSDPTGPIDILDTPPQQFAVYGNPEINSCEDVIEKCESHPASFFSFMDYTDDAAMSIFTADQSAVINWHANQLDFHSDVTYCAGEYQNVNCNPNVITCHDGIQNQDEQNIDCGGTGCSPCSSIEGIDFFDDGGPFYNYSRNSYYEWTFCPDYDSQNLSITFEEWDVESHETCDYDVLRIFDGSSTSDPEIGSGYCSLSPGIITASAPGNCLTFSFQSDNSVVRPGWQATLSSIGTVLPVDILNFELSLVRDHVELSWETQYELNNQGFEILRSTAGEQYEIIHFEKNIVDSQTNKIKYNFIDEAIAESTTYYYKLRQIDLNGTESFSEIKSIETARKLEASQIVLSPNPLVSNLLNIDFKTNENTEYRFEIINTQGQKLLFGNLNSDHFELDASSLSPGIYFFNVYNESQIVSSKKLIKI